MRIFFLLLVLAGATLPACQRAAYPQLLAAALPGATPVVAAPAATEPVGGRLATWVPARPAAAVATDGQRWAARPARVRRPVLASRLAGLAPRWPAASARPLRRLVGRPQQTGRLHGGNFLFYLLAAVALGCLVGGLLLAIGGDVAAIVGGVLLVGLGLFLGLVWFGFASWEKSSG